MHPQTEPAGTWYLVIPDGPAFDGGPDFLVGPYVGEAEAWEAHHRLEPWPCRVDRFAPGAYDECDCVALQAIRERVAA